VRRHSKGDRIQAYQRVAVEIAGFWVNPCRPSTLADMQTERDQLVLELAAIRGQLTGMTVAIQSAEARVTAAESQLAKASPVPRKRR